jgi:hypothetical protein
MRLRASREGFEALRMQAQSRENLRGGVARSDAPGRSGLRLRQNTKAQAR